MADDYEVGYAKPPKHSQFKPGQSGNPKGQPKKSRTAEIDVAAILDQPIKVKQGGKSQIMGTFEATVRGFVKRALNDGDLWSAIQLVRLCEKYEILVPAPQSDGGGVFVVPKGWTPEDFVKAHMTEAQAIPDGANKTPCRPDRKTAAGDK